MKNKKENQVQELRNQILSRHIQNNNKELVKQISENYKLGIDYFEETEKKNINK